MNSMGYRPLMNHGMSEADPQTDVDDRDPGAVFASSSKTEDPASLADSGALSKSLSHHTRKHKAQGPVWGHLDYSVKGQEARRISP